MTDRDAELRRIAETLSEREEVRDAFLAKSFTGRLLICDLEGPLPAGLAAVLRARDLEPAEAVYGDEAAMPTGFGDVGDATRHHFVDVRTRGSHQSYVVE